MLRLFTQNFNVVLIRLRPTLTEEIFVDFFLLLYVATKIIFAHSSFSAQKMVFVLNEILFFIEISRLNNPDDLIAGRLNERLRNNSFPNIGTTCMKDAPPASTNEPYSCGLGEKDFTTSADSQDYNRYAKCSECFSRTLQVVSR